MNKEELLQKLSAAKARLICIDQKLSAAKKELADIEQQLKEVDKLSAEQFVIDCIEGCTIHKDEGYPDSVFYMKDGRVWFEIKNKDLWVRYNPVWKVLEKQYHLSYTDTKRLIKNVVEEHFNWQGLTPPAAGQTYPHPVEEHFNWQGLTPLSLSPALHSLVEEHFNWQGLTPRIGYYLERLWWKNISIGRD